jgi:predicted TIM-barrel fold metal-dependent hydrolase
MTAADNPAAEAAAPTASASASAPVAVELPADEPQRLTALAADLGIPGFVDIHTHFMPNNVLTKVWDYFDRAEERGLRPWPIAYRWDEAARVQRLRDMGVRAFTSMLYPHRAGMAEWLNGWSADFAARTPDCAHTSTFYPEPEAADYTRAALEAGTKVFKSHIQVGGYDPADPLLDPVWAQIAEAGVPVVIHCGSGPVPGRHTGLEPVRQVLGRHPDLALVIAHTGTPEYAEFLGLAQDYERVCLDTCMTFTPYIEERAPFPSELLPALVDLQDKVVLGSDYPNIPYPYSVQIDSIRGLGLGADIERKILHDNGARLLGLD